MKKTEPVTSNAASEEAARYATSVADHYRRTWPQLVDRLVPRFGAYAREPDEAPGMVVLDAGKGKPADASCGLDELHNAPKPRPLAPERSGPSGTSLGLGPRAQCGPLPAGRPG